MTEILTVTRAGSDPFTYGQLRNARFAMPVRGLRVLADTPTDPELDARIAIAASAPGNVLCDVSAARWWGLPLPTYLRNGESHIGVAAPAGNAEPRNRKARGRRLLLPIEHVVEHRGCLVTTPARTWIDCAAVMREEFLLAMGDAGLHAGLFSTADIRAMVHWAYRRRGVATARRIWPMLNGLAESPGESRVRYHLLQTHMAEPECQIELLHYGEFVARLDLGWRDRKLAVEYDGIVHLSEEQRRRDAWRRNRIQQAGWRLIVVTGDDMQRIDQMVSLIRQAYNVTPLLVECALVAGNCDENEQPARIQRGGWGGG
jgi:very-short-patch-repair endonuclease